jgi:hypothetical protein
VCTVPIVPHNIRRRALHLLYGSPDGCTANVLAVHGIPNNVVADMFGAGLVSVELEPVAGGGPPAEETRVRITEAGRQALAR